MTKAAVFDASGLPTAFYEPSFQTVPEGAVEISDEQWQELLNNQGQRYWTGSEVAVYLPPIVPPTTADLLAYAADKRWQVETGGITVAGAEIDTNRDSQAMITGAYAYSQAHPEEPIKFKAASGWVTLDAATMAAIATAVGAHVQESFAVEEAVDAAIAAGTITTFEEIDAAGWPSNGS